MEKITKKLSEFLATLELETELPETSVSGELLPFLEKVFEKEENFWRFAESLQNLKGTYKTKEELIEKISEMLRSQPEYFLVLTHLHRQKRFTNVELVHMLFDQESLDDLSYYNSLMKSDQDFKRVVERTRAGKKWTSYVGKIDAGSSEDSVLASFKKAVSLYLGSEDVRWKRWKSRIENDPTVSKRIAEFVVRNEDLEQLIEGDVVVSALERSLRIVNVETIKQERGEYGSRRVEEILTSAGFAFRTYDKMKDIGELEEFLESQKTLVDMKNRFIFTKEKDLRITETDKTRKKDKRVDFVLISKGKVKFVIETNYFTTSMSKVGEVVENFMKLKEACGERHRLIYITDGVGWFGKVADIKKMIEFEIEQKKTDPSPVEFLMNLEMLRRNMDLIKSQMEDP